MLFRSRDAEIVFDVGANAAIYSLAAIAANKNAQVYAFEPTPEIADGINNTVKLNDLARLRVCRLAVTDRDGVASLNRYHGGDKADNDGMNFVTLESKTADSVTVPTTSIDSFCHAHAIARIDLMKIDVQGHEASVLRGAEKMLAAGSIGTIFLELNWAEIGRAHV